MKTRIIAVSSILIFFLTSFIFSQDKQHIDDQPGYFYSVNHNDASNPQLTTVPQMSQDPVRDEIVKQLRTARLNNDIPRIKQLEQKLNEIDGSQPSEFINDPNVTGIRETVQQIDPNGNGISTIGNGPFWAIATQTTSRSPLIFAALTEYNAAGGDKLKMYVSYDQGVTWVLKGVAENFNTGFRFYNDELDIEPLATLNDTLLYAVAGYVYNGKRCTMIARCNISTGTVNLQTFSMSSQTTKNYGARITSDNLTYALSPYIYITVANDSLKSANVHSLKQRLCVIMNPLSTVFTQTNKIATPSTGGFCWGLNNATDTTWMWQDVAFYNNGNTDIIYTSCIFRGFNNVYNAWSLDLGGTIASSLVITETMPTSKVKIAFNGGGSITGSIIYLRNYTTSPNGDVDVRSQNTIGGITLNSFTPGYVEFTTDTALSCDVQAIKKAYNKHKYAYSVKGDKCYYTSNVSFNMYSPAVIVNNFPAGADYGRVRAGYRITATDSCLAVWSGSTGGGMYCTYGCSMSTGVEYNTESGIPEKYSLSQNYPNPFNPSTTIKFSIPKQSNVRLYVYDITGKVVSELVNDNLQTGNYNISFDASGLASGIYFYRLTTDGFTEVKKMMMIK